MSRIFINYRREDTGMGVGRLTDSLREYFAADRIFQDISSIAPGADFIEALQQALADCAVVLVVIGPKWLATTDRQGRRRLDDPEDWVRQEIIEALGRPDLRVFPLLVDGAEMPGVAELPEAIRPLARRQAHELTLRHWAKDIAVLVEALQRLPMLMAEGRPGEGEAGPLERADSSPEPEAPAPASETSDAHAGRKGLAVTGIVLAAVGLGVWLTAVPDGGKVEEAPAVDVLPKSAVPDQALAKPELPAQASKAAKLIQPTPPAKPAASVKGESGSFTGEMVSLPAGCFEMGSPPDEWGVNDARQHRVCVDAFAIGKVEVTQSQWQSIMGGNPSRFKCADCPVEQVTWTDAMAFVAKLNASTGKNYRLPTEAEWEYACRGGRPGELYCGADNPDSVAWYSANSGGRTHPVGQKGGNRFGLHDMSGNVREWTCSHHDNHYEGDERQCAISPSSIHIARGGGWDSSRQLVRSGFRLSFTIFYREKDLGFRLARTLP
jgi:formylglycine-generating enzyme required for sulfatase activity